MILYHYQCISCGDMTNNKEMKSFCCECGGDYHHIDKSRMSPSQFVPHYSPEVKQMVYSWKDAEKKGKEFRSPDHPNGFVLTQENKKFISELKYIKKHREEYIQEQYSKKGLAYKPGRKVKFDDSTRSFVPSPSQ